MSEEIDLNSAVVVQLKRALNEPVNFLRLLITKSEAFERFRRSISKSSLMLAIVDATVSQISIEWLKQRAGEFERFVTTAKRLLTLATRMVALRKTDSKICLVSRVGSKGEIAIAWLLLANREFPGEMSAAEARELPLDSEVGFELQDGYHRIDLPSNCWIRRFGTPSNGEARNPAIASSVCVRRDGFDLTVRLLPTNDRAFFTSPTQFLQGKFDFKILRCRLLEFMENEQHGFEGVRVEIIARASSEDRARAEEAVFRLQSDVRELAAELIDSIKTAKSVTVADTGGSYTRRLPPRIQSLVPDEFHKLVRQVAEYQRQVQNGERSDNYAVILLGEPGTGKTSSVLQLASELAFTVYTVSLKYLIQTSRTSTGHTLFLVEEFETSFAQTIEAEDELPSNAAAPTTTKSTADRLSKLYNILDGLSSIHGCLIVFTANSIPNELRENYRPFFRMGRINTVVKFPSRIEPHRIREAVKQRLELEHPDVCELALAECHRLSEFTPSEISEFLGNLVFAARTRDEDATAHSIFSTVLETIDQEKTIRCSG